MPQSSLMLVSALGGRRRAARILTRGRRYRFYSYGDALLIVELPDGKTCGMKIELYIPQSPLPTIGQLELGIAVVAQWVEHAAHIRVVRGSSP